jgi:hypothetical protein
MQTLGNFLKLLFYVLCIALCFALIGVWAWVPIGLGALWVVAQLMTERNKKVS